MDKNPVSDPAIEENGARQHSTEAEITAPIILSLGKKKQKQIKRLKRGRGSVMNEVMDVIDQVQANLGEDAAGKIIVPVVVVYRKKDRKFKGWF